MNSMVWSWMVDWAKIDRRWIISNKRVKFNYNYKLESIFLRLKSPSLEHSQPTKIKICEQHAQST